MDNKDTLCGYAFDYPIVNLGRNELRQCCRTTPNTVTKDDIDQLGTKLFSQFHPIVQTKKDLLNGIRSPACASCWKIEDNGGKSPRTGKHFIANMLVGKKWFGNLSKVQIEDKLSNLSEQEINRLATEFDVPRMLEILLSNTCDLKCMYCNHHYSSQWAAERLKYKEIPIEILGKELPKPNKEYENTFWKYFVETGFRTISAINFLGGEPLILDEFYEYLDKILTIYETYENQDELPKRIVLTIITNMNCTEKHFERLVKVIPRIVNNPRLHLDFNVSLEAIGERTEFIRTGTNWERLDKNINTMLSIFSNFPPVEKSRLHFNFQVAINALCISDFPNFFRYIISLREKFNIAIGFRENQVVFPAWLSPVILPCEYSRYIDESIEVLSSRYFGEENIDKQNNLSSYIVFLRSIKNSIANTNKDMEAQKLFVTELDKLCTRRKLNFKETFPEMIEFYNIAKAL